MFSLKSSKINEIAENYWEDGVRHIVALRGDSPVDIKKNILIYVLIYKECLYMSEKIH